MLFHEGRRFTRDVLTIDPEERAERAEAAERLERARRIEAEGTAAELAHMLAGEIEARRHAEAAADELARLVAAQGTAGDSAAGRFAAH